VSDYAIFRLGLAQQQRPRKKWNWTQK